MIYKLLLTAHSILFLQIVLVGVKGNGAFGDISIDDTSLRAEKCGYSPNSAASPPTVPTPTKLPTTTPSVQS